MSSLQGVGIEEFHCIQRCPLSHSVYYISHVDYVKKSLVIQFQFKDEEFGVERLKL